MEAEIGAQTSRLGEIVPPGPTMKAYEREIIEAITRKPEKERADIMMQELEFRDRTTPWKAIAAMLGVSGRLTRVVAKESGKPAAREPEPESPLENIRPISFED